MVQTFLMLNSGGSLFISFLVVAFGAFFQYELKIDHEGSIITHKHLIYSSFAVAKVLFMVPFIVYEYYLIIFENIFIDGCHFMTTLKIENPEVLNSRRKQVNEHISAAPASGEAKSKLSKKQ